MNYLIENAIKMIGDGNLKLQPHLQVLSMASLGMTIDQQIDIKIDLSIGFHKQKDTVRKKIQ